MWTEIPWSHWQRTKAAEVDRDQSRIVEKGSRKYTDYWCQDVITFRIDKWIIKAHQNPPMVYGFTAKSKRKNSAESGSTPVDCKWRSCNKCNAKHHICTSVKPPIRILADTEQDKSEKPCEECFGQK